MRAGAAQIQTRQRRAVITPARHRPETEQLMQRHRAMKDVAAGQRETSFEFERRQQLAMQDRCAEIWRVSVDRVDATFGECVTAFVPVAARDRKSTRLHSSN